MGIIEHPSDGLRHTIRMGSLALAGMVWAGTVVENGTIFRPYDTFPEAIAVVPNGGILSIVEGTYPASEGNTFIIGDDGRSMWLRAPVGDVIIGD